MSTHSGSMAGMQRFRDAERQEQEMVERQDSDDRSSRMGSFMVDSPKFDDSRGGSSVTTEQEDLPEQILLVTVVWRALKVVSRGGWRKSNRKILLNKVDGFVEPRSVLAVVGPAGSGKSALLAALASQLGPHSAWGGEILINGRPRDSCGIDPTFASEDDPLLPYMTVEQLLLYSGHLQLKSKDRGVVEQIAREVCQQLGLMQDLGRLTQELPRGLHRRVAVALHLLNPSPLLIFHDVLQGLNEGDALAIMRAVAEACREGATAVMSCQQPTTDTASFFNRAYILCAGELVYFGDTSTQALALLSSSGMPCPPLYSPIEQFMRLIDPSFEVYLQVIPGSDEEWSARFSSMMFKVTQDAYNASQVCKDQMARQAELLEAAYQEPPPPTIRVPFHTQLWVLLTRMLFQGLRCIPLYLSRLFFGFLIAVAYGATYHGLSHSWQGVLDRTSLLFVVSAVLPFLTVISMPINASNADVFTHEHSANILGLITHLTATAIIALPHMLVEAILTSVIVIPLAGLNSASGAWAYFIVNTFLGLSVADVTVAAVAAWLRSPYLQQIVSMMVLGTQILACGYFAGARFGLNKAIGAVSFVAYSYEGLVRNEFSGSAMWGCPGETLFNIPGCQLSGGQVWDVLNDDYDVVLGSKWIGVYVLIGMLVFWELVFAGGLIFRIYRSRGERMHLRWI